MNLHLTVCLAQANRPERYGAKAANLARVLGAGLATPAGFVLDVQWLHQHLQGLGLGPRAAALYAALETQDIDDKDVLAEGAALREAITQSTLTPALLAYLEANLLSGNVYAVRSSAPGEDGAQASFAGQFDSVLNCQSLAQVADAVRHVWASLWNARALRYARQRRCGPQGMAILIQEQVQAVVSGVMFTRDPRQPDSPQLLVEYCAGLGEALVSGQITPARLTIERSTGAVVQEQPAEFPLAVDITQLPTINALQTLAQQLETLFGAPQDIEWSLDAAGQLYVLQARPITAEAASAAIPDDPSATTVWTNANIAENFPEPVCPLLCSFVIRGYAAYFRSLGQAFGIAKPRMLAMRHALDHLVGCQGGRLYYNLSYIHTALYLAPGGPLLARYFNQFTGAQDFPAPQRLSQSRIAQAVEYVRVALRVVWRYLFVQRAVRRFEAEVDAYAQASAPAQLGEKSPAQLALLLQGFLHIRLQRWTGAALADTAAMVCYGLLQALLRGYAQVDVNDLLKGLPGLASAVPVERLWDLSRQLRQNPTLRTVFEQVPAQDILHLLRQGQFADFQASLKHYFDTWGFRSSGELMLSKPTPQEDPLPLLRLLKSYAALEGSGPAEISQQQAQARLSATAQARQQLRGWRRLVFLRLLRCTQGAILLRERARMKQALLYTRLRHVALALGQICVKAEVLAQADDVLYLDIDQVIANAQALAQAQAAAKHLGAQVAQVAQVAQRRAELALQMTHNPPDNLVLPAGKSWQFDLNTAAQTSGPTGSLFGTGACGGRACGTAAVVLDVADIDRIQADQILVTRQTDPGWASVFFMIKGLVIERGGLLSHGAIIAREYGIPAVVGVPGATTRITNGQTLCVDGKLGRVDCEDKNS